MLEIVYLSLVWVLRQTSARDSLKKVNSKINILPDITGTSFRDHANYSADC